MASITLKHVSKTYPGNTKKSVDDFNMEIQDGEFIVFVGPSGCGKSTTLRMIAGLEDITDGELYIDGKYMNDVEPKDRNIAMVFQNYALFPNMTVAQNIGFCLKISKVLREKDYKCPTSPKKLRNLWYKVQYPFVKKLKYRHLKKEEIDEIMNCYKTINNIGIKMVNLQFFANCILKIIIYSVICLI